MKCVNHERCFTAQRVSTGKRSVLFVIVGILLGVCRAYAGTWQITYVPNGQVTCNGGTPAFAPWQPSTGYGSFYWGTTSPVSPYYQLYSTVDYQPNNLILFPGSSLFYPYSPAVTSLSASGTVTVTMTWKPSTLNSISDPAPAVVVVNEIASAGWTNQLAATKTAITQLSGTASDGLGDAFTEGYVELGLATLTGWGGYANGSRATVLPVDQASGTATLTDTLSTSCSAPYGIIGSEDMEFSVQIVAVPYAPSITAISPSSTENDLTWNSATNGLGNPVAKYNIYRSTNDNDPMPWTLLGTSTTTNYKHAILLLCDSS